jgi:hypothetical protein
MTKPRMRPAAAHSCNRARPASWARRWDDVERAGDPRRHRVPWHRRAHHRRARPGRPGPDRERPGRGHPAPPRPPVDPAEWHDRGPGRAAPRISRVGRRRRPSGAATGGVPADAARAAGLRAGPAAAAGGRPLRGQVRPCAAAERGPRHGGGDPGHRPGHRGLVGRYLAVRRPRPGPLDAPLASRAARRGRQRPLRDPGQALAPDRRAPGRPARLPAPGRPPRPSRRRPRRLGRRRRRAPRPAGGSTVWRLRGTSS